MTTSDLTPKEASSQGRFITLVIPARNEEGNIARLEKEVLEVVATLPQYEFEFIVIDNNSADQTGALVKEICARDPRWRYIRFSRNFSVEMSITAGYHFAKGDAMIVLYSDLQDPPNVIPQFLEKWEEGWNVVYGVRTVRTGDPQWRNLFVKIAYRLIAFSAEVSIPTDAGDFRLIDRQVRDALEQVHEQNRYMRGLIAWLGFHQTSVPYERRPRKTGRSNAPLWDTVFFTFNAITAFSMKPLRLFTFLGFILLTMSALGIIIYTALFLIGQPPAGITTLIVLSLFGLGLNSLGFGILGEYVGRTYTEVKARPLYIIQEQVGFPLPPQRSFQERISDV